MKIFIIPTSYPDDEFPVKDIFINEQAMALSKLGHTVTVLHVKKLPSKQIVSHIKSGIQRADDGFAIRYIKIIKTFLEDKFPLLNKNAFVNAMRELFVEAQKVQGVPDVLYAHFSCWAGYAATEISKEFNIPCVTMEHSGRLVQPGQSVSKTVINCVKKTVKESEEFLCVSPGLRASIRKIVPDAKNLSVITNMIDSRFEYRPRINKGKFVFLSIGRLVASKRFDQLIDAFVQAFDENENVELRIGGNGELKDKLENKIKLCNREKQIKLLGQLNRSVTLEEYIKCDCFVLPSTWETFGLVYREAMAVGRPIITTDHGGFDSNTWNDDCGYMIPVNDISALSDALKAVILNYDSFNGRDISKFCLSTCSSSIVSKKIEDKLLCAIDRRKKIEV